MCFFGTCISLNWQIVLVCTHAHLSVLPIVRAFANHSAAGIVKACDSVVYRLDTVQV